MPLQRLLAFGLLGTWATQAGAEIRIYDVRPEYLQEVADLLEEIFSADVDPNTYPDLYGRVQLLPSGQILVDASEDRQTEVARVMAALEASPATEFPSVALRYWVVFGVPGGEDSNTLPAALAEPLRELDAAQGPFGFTLLDSATVMSRAGRYGGLESETLEIMQRVYPNGDRINADVNFEHELQELTVQFSLERGEYLVLGNGTATNEEGTRGTLAVIVHWPTTN